MMQRFCLRANRPDKAVHSVWVLLLNPPGGLHKIMDIPLMRKLLNFFLLDPINKINKFDDVFFVHPVLRSICYQIDIAQ